MEQAEFRIFYESTAPRLRAYILRRCGVPDVADDILQEAFLRFLRAVVVQTTASGRRAYLYRIAQSLIVDRWRRSRIERAWAQQAPVHDNVQNVEISDDMQRAFNRLKPQQQSLLWLAYVEGFDHREIAIALGVREKSVRVLLFRARSALAEILDREGLGPEVA